MGFTLLLLMFAAITLGGLGNPFGALVGSLVVGIVRRAVDVGRSLTSSTSRTSAPWSR